MAETKVRFSGEDNVSPILNKLKKDSEELGRGLIRDARAYTTSGKETLAYLEEQIKAIEKKSKAEKDFQMLSLKAQQSRGDITPQKFKEKASQVEASSSEDAQQVILLKEMIDTIKNVSKKEIVENRKLVDKQLAESKSVDKLSPKGDELQILKETLQREQLGNIKDQERTEKDRFAGIKVLGDRVNQAGGMVAGSQNQFYMAASIVGMIPFIGAAAGSLMERAFSTAERYQSARGGITQLTGGQQGWGHGSGMQSIGLTKGEFLEFEKQFALARGSYGDESKMLRRATNMAVFEKATGFDRGLLLEQEKLTRGGGLGSVGGSQNLVKALQSIGVVKGQDTTIVNEYLPLLVNIQQEQLKITGETNNKISTDLIAGITNLDESFKNPEYLKNILPSLMGGMKQATTPQAEALQYRALSKSAPGLSLLDLQEMKENPTLESLKMYLDQLKQVSLGNEDVFAVNIRGAFQGLSTKQARQIASGYTSGKMDLSDYSKELGITNVAGRAGGATGLIDAASADWAQTFETAGNDISNIVQKLIDENIPDALKQVKESVIDLSKNISDFNKRHPIVSSIAGGALPIVGVVNMIADKITEYNDK